MNGSVASQGYISVSRHASEDRRRWHDLRHETLVQTGYLEKSMFQWSGFTLDGDVHGRTVDLTVAGADGRYWRLAAQVVLKPSL
jgi:hypothetical protein